MGARVGTEDEDADRALGWLLDALRRGPLTKAGQSVSRSIEHGGALYVLQVVCVGKTARVDQERREDGD